MYWLTLYNGPNDKEGTVIHNPFPKGGKTSAAKGKLAIKGIANMSFTINHLNPMWGQIKPYHTLIKVEDSQTNELVFNGRVLNLKQSMSSGGMFSENYECEDVLAYLYDSIQLYMKVQNASVSAFLQLMLDQHNSQVEAHKRFKLGNVTVADPNDSLYRFLGYEKTYDAIKEKLLDSLGGFLVVRYEADGMYLDYLSSVGVKSETAIRLRKNLKSMDKSIAPQNIITKLVPLGAKLEGKNGVVDSFDNLGDGTRVARVEIEDQNDLLNIPVSLLPNGTDVGSYLIVYGTAPNYVISASNGSETEDSAQPRTTIASVNNGVNYLLNNALVAEFGVIQGKVEYDDVTTPAALMSKGITDLNSQTISTTYSVVSVDYSLIDGSYDQLKIGNWHDLENPILTIDEPIQITEIGIDFIDPRNPDLTLGEKQTKLSQYQKESNKRVENIIQLQKTVESQTKSIVKLTSANNEVVKKYDKMQLSYDSLSATLEIDNQTGTSLALINLKKSIDDLGEEIPTFSLATSTSDGLMPSSDKNKLDNLEEYTEATQSKSGLFSVADKTKLDLVTVSSPVDLNDIVTRLIALEPQE